MTAAESREANIVVRPAVRAAGGVVWYCQPHSGIQVLLVHRPKYDDWSLPKGKVNKGETDIECALREVEEETGLRCRLGEELPSTRYRDRRGRDKTVRYWAMEPIAGMFLPNHEVDEVRWLPPNEAQQLLSYRRDADVIAGFAGRRVFPPTH